MSQLAECLGFDLTDTFAGHIELFADLFQGVIRIHVDAKTHPQHFGLPSGEAGENLLGALSQASYRRMLNG